MLYPVNAQDKSVIESSHGSQRNIDCVLIEQIARKDKQAFEQLYLSYHRRLFQFVFRLVHQPEAAEEVVNDVMFVVWREAGKFQGRSRVSTWIHGIAYRKGLKALKRQGKYHKKEVDLDDSTLDTIGSISVDEPQERVANTEFIEQLKRGIHTLSVEHRSVLELTVLGHSYGEISEILDCPVNTVKTRMFHARRRLKKTLSNPQYTKKGHANRRPL